MIESQEQLQSVFNTMKLNVTFDFIPKFTKRIASYIGNCVDDVVRNQKDAITKRLQKRRQRLFVGCKHRSDKIKCYCDCNRCTYRLKDKRENNEMCCMDNDQAHSSTLTQKRTQDHRDVQALDLTTGWEWWMKMQESAARMPSLQHDAAAPTKSVCSTATSRSYSNSCNALMELNEEIDKMQTDNSINCQVVERSSERRSIAKRSRQAHEGSKSDSKIESGRGKTKCSSVFKSASTKTTCVRRSRNKRRNFSLTKRRFRKRRPCKTKSHRASCYEPCVQYFKNLSKKK